MYVLYGTGYEAERFIFQNLELMDEIGYCIDQFHVGFFHGKPIVKLEEVDDLGNSKILITAAEFNVYSEIANALKKLGLVEFVDFIWSKAYGKKIVLVNANCHGPAVITYLEKSTKFCEEYFIYPIPQVQENRMKEIPRELLDAADVYIHLDIRANNAFGYKLSDEYVLPRLKIDCKSITIPNFVGMGDWMYPAMGELEKVVTTKTGPKYILFKDSILSEAIENGYKNVDELKKIWLEFKYTEEELEQKWKTFLRKLEQREKEWDVKIYQFIVKNYRKIPCFVDKSHPSKYVMREVGRQVAELLNLHDIEDEDYESGLGIPTPLLPCVQKYFELEFEVPREKKADWLGKTVEEEMNDYIKAYLWWYHDITT